MSRNRFKLLLSVIHFVDNEATEVETKKDRLRKLRPFLGTFRAQCLKVIPRQRQFTGEMMVPYKGTFGDIRHIQKGNHIPGVSKCGHVAVSVASSMTSLYTRERVAPIVPKR